MFAFVPIDTSIITPRCACAPDTTECLFLCKCFLTLRCVRAPDITRRINSYTCAPYCEIAVPSRQVPERARCSGAAVCQVLCFSVSVALVVFAPRHCSCCAQMPAAPSTASSSTASSSTAASSSWVAPAVLGALPACVQRMVCSSCGVLVAVALHLSKHSNHRLQFFVS